MDLFSSRIGGEEFVLLKAVRYAGISLDSVQCVPKTSGERVIGDFPVSFHMERLVVRRLGNGDGSECYMCESMGESLQSCKKIGKFAFGKAF